MNYDNISNDLAKELFMVLSFCEDSFIDSIPQNVLDKIISLSADSNKDFFIDENKSLNEQNISDDCKDLLSLMYYMYVTDDIEKNEILDSWLKNDSVSN